MSPRTFQRAKSKFITDALIKTGLSAEALLLQVLTNPRTGQERAARIGEFLMDLINKYGITHVMFDCVQRYHPFTEDELANAKDNANLSYFQLMAFVRLKPELFPKNVVEAVAQALKRQDEQAVTVTDEEPLADLPDSVFACLDVSGLLRQAVAVLAATGGCSQRFNLDFLVSACCDQVR
jgi:hypothetical protein